MVVRSLIHHIIGIALRAGLFMIVATTTINELSLQKGYNISVN
jgi:hypothetical protein